MRRLLPVLVAACAHAQAPAPEPMPDDVLAHQDPGADTSHNRETYLDNDGCRFPVPTCSGATTTGGGEYSHGCGTPRGGGRGRGGGIAMLGAFLMTQRRRRR